MKHSVRAPFRCWFARAAIALWAVAVFPVAWAADLTLVWSDNSDNETGFKIERSSDGSSYSQITTVSANTETYTDTDLLADTTYWYRVRATNAAGDSGYSNPANAVTSGSGPSAAPTPTLTSPSDGMLSTVGDPVSISATLSGDTSLLARVEFFADSSKIGEDSSAPFTMSWDNAPVGSHVLIARAVNSDGASATSTGITVSVVPDSSITVDLASGGSVTLVTQDIGAVGNAGSSILDSESGELTIVAGGSDIWNNEDGFHFVWTEVTGDLTVLTRIQSLTESHRFAKAGVMIRESLSADSVHALAHANANGGLFFTRRTSEGGATSAISAPPLGTPIWMRMQRVGGEVTGAYSTDGVDWIEIGAENLDLPETIFVGLAATAHTLSATTTAVFTDFDLIHEDQLGLTVSLTEPIDQSVFEVGESLAVTAVVSDPSETSRVELLVDGGVIGQDSTAPYIFLWSGAEPGPHMVQARAIDLEGDSSLSDLITVSVEDSTLVVDPPSPGTYRGEFSLPTVGADEGGQPLAEGEETGRFSVWVDPEGSVHFIGAESSIGAMFSVKNVTLSGDGSFIVVSSVGLDTVIVRGRITSKGIEGTIDGTDLVLEGSLADSGGPSEPAAGFYEAFGVRTPDTCVMVIVGGDGLGFVSVSKDGLVMAAEVPVELLDGEASMSSVELDTDLTLDLAQGTVDGSISVQGSPDIELMGIRGDVAALRRLENLSTRGVIAPNGGIMITGFVVSGTEPKDVLIRTIGPGLTAFGIQGNSVDPVLELKSDSGVVATNNRWIVGNVGSVIDTVSAQVGAFPLDPSSQDAVLLVTVAPGRYSAVVNDASGQGGDTLIEIYDASKIGVEGNELSNLSTRGFVTSVNNLIGGFVVTGNLPKRVLVRGVGPGLANFGISDALPEVRLLLTQRVDGEDVRIGGFDAWGTQPNADAIAEAALDAGAFELDSGSSDSAILLWLEPGVYTAVIQPGSNQLTGTALVEVYQVD